VRNTSNILIGIPEEKRESGDNDKVRDLHKALLGSIPVGTFQHARHATVLWKCFLLVREWTVNIQRMHGDVTQQ
jgi:hypothetical protein